MNDLFANTYDKLIAYIAIIIIRMKYLVISPFLLRNFPNRLKWKEDIINGIIQFRGILDIATTTVQQYGEIQNRPK